MHFLRSSSSESIKVGPGKSKQNLYVGYARGPQDKNRSHLNLAYNSESNSQKCINWNFELKT